VPTLLGIVIILLVVILVVLIVNFQMTKGLGEGQRVVGTVGGELLTGEEAPEEFIDASALGGRAEPVEGEQPSPETLGRMAEARDKASEARVEAEEEGGPVEKEPVREPRRERQPE
jgi:hypothetical protein